MKNINILLLICVCLGMNMGCVHKERFSDTPKIESVTLTKISNGTNKDSDGLLVIHFTDGDGDIGLDEDDTMPPFDTTSAFYYNYFITYYELQNGVWVSPPELENNFHVRLPRFLQGETKEPLQGNIDLIININNPYSPYDTIKFDCQIVDRALRKSNIVTTQEIIINK